jgi:hypothetical protein
MLSSRGLACPWPNRIRRLVDGLFRKLTKPILLDPVALARWIWMPPRNAAAPHAHCRFSRPKFSTGVAMGLVPSPFAPPRLGPFFCFLRIPNNQGTWSLLPPPMLWGLFRK